MSTASLVAVLLLGLAAILSCGGGTSSNRSSELGNQSPHNPDSSGRSGSTPKTLQFSGYDWTVKTSSGRVGPGPNYFSDGGDSVSVDAQGRLHLRIRQQNGRWYCAEVISTRSFGYGTYRFYLEGKVDNLDPQIVLGMFTWNDAPVFNHREIDIEISRWGQADNQNAQFVLQPYTHAPNVLRFQIPAGLLASTHAFTWKPDNILCQSSMGSAGDYADPSKTIKQHTFTAGIPQPGGEKARINFWLFAGHPPTDGQEAEVIISKFEFAPLQP